ncbi:MAG: IS200/IS605 family transposase, partial [Gammaproteobacteria bacterium]|nr:IS200/IS605 family transposase [Gammaproteobacteria bacterium]
MRDYKSLTHTRWDSEYHVVFFPKKRKKQIYGAIRKHLGKMLHE